MSLSLARRYNAGIVRVTDQLFLTGDGITTSTVLKDYHGNTVASDKLKHISAINQQDWQTRSNAEIEVTDLSTGWAVTGTGTITSTVTTTAVDSTSAVYYTIARSAAGSSGWFEYFTPPASPPEKITMYVWLRAGTSTSCVVGFFNSTSGYGTAGDTQTTVVSGPANVAGTTSSAVVASLSTTVDTLLKVERTVRAADTGLWGLILTPYPTASGDSFLAGLIDVTYSAADDTSIALSTTARTNILYPSDDFSGATVQPGISLAVSTTAIGGTGPLYWGLQTNGSNSYANFFTIPANTYVAGDVLDYIFWCKADTITTIRTYLRSLGSNIPGDNSQITIEALRGNATFSAQSGSYITCTLTPGEDNLIRVTRVFDAKSAANAMMITSWPGSGGNTIVGQVLIGAIQVVINGVAVQTAYIPTTTAAVTVTDYTPTGSSIALGQTPAIGAELAWTGVIER